MSLRTPSAIHQASSAVLTPVSPELFGCAVPESKRQELLQEALTLYGFGWNVLPAVEKRPFGRWRPYMNLRISERELCRRFVAASRLTGIAVVPGWLSGGLAVRDFDTPNGYAKWAADFPRAAKVLPTVRTGRGMHAYMRLPSGYSGPTSAIFPKSHPYGPGEFRGTANGIVMLPPSAHPKGGYYEWSSNRPFSAGDVPRLDPRRVGVVALADTSAEDPTRGAARVHPHTACVSHLFPHEIRGISHAVELSLPKGAGERESSIWKLCRALLTVANGEPLSQEVLEHAFDLWWASAKWRVGTKDRSESEKAFWRAWERVRIPLSPGIRAAARLAETAPLPAVASGYEPVQLRALVRLVAALSEQRNGTFFLSIRSAAKQLKVSPKTADRYLKRLQSDGVLQLIRPGVTAAKSKTAATWRFVPDATPQARRKRGRPRKVVSN